MPNPTISYRRSTFWTDAPVSVDDYRIASGSWTQDDGVTLRRSLAGEPGSPQALHAAFDFLQRNAEGRYSDRTLMAISRWSGRAESIVSGGVDSDGPLPWVFSLSKEVAYDEDTEVKSGGTVALAVTLPAEWGAKLVMAVHPDGRRQGYGTRLMYHVKDYVSGVHAWVGNTNIVGQQFLLSIGMSPSSMNGRGALLYSFGDIPESDGVAR